MDPRTIEINNLRVLNDYLNQTIDVLLRAQRLGVPTAGLSHSPYGASPYAASIFGTSMVPGLGIDPTLQGLSHSPFAGGVPFGGAVPTPFGAIPTAGAYPTVVDPFSAQRGLAHTPFAHQAGMTPWSPLAEIARQQQLVQALAARQQVNALYQTWPLV